MYSSITHFPVFIYVRNFPKSTDKALCGEVNVFPKFDNSSQISYMNTIHTQSQYAFNQKFLCECGSYTVTEVPVCKVVSQLRIR